MSNPFVGDFSGWDRVVCVSLSKSPRILVLCVKDTFNTEMVKNTQRSDWSVESDSDETKAAEFFRNQVRIFQSEDAHKIEEVLKAFGLWEYPFSCVGRPLVHNGSRSRVLGLRILSCTGTQPWLEFLLKEADPLRLQIENRSSIVLL